jgi:hypothetical protein
MLNETELLVCVHGPPPGDDITGRISTQRNRVSNGILDASGRGVCDIGYSWRLGFAKARSLEGVRFSAWDG